MTTDKSNLLHTLGFDPATISRKYEEEADKRTARTQRPQPLSASPGHPVSTRDPFAVPLDRKPLADEVDVVVIGGGFTGLITSSHLRRDGVPLIRVIDKAGGFGGVWYWNRYPGIRCDANSFVYLPLLEEVDTIPSEMFAHGDEIRAHCAALAEKFELDEAACLQTQVTGMRWQESTSQWLVSTDRGDRISARFVCLGSGTMHSPAVPAVPGLEEFTGKVFHSSRWDYAYTGGDSQGGLTKLADKRVAVIGTAASAIQFIPHVAAAAKELLVVQRTPVIVNPRDNQAIDPCAYRSRTPGWQQELIDNFTAVTQTPVGQTPPEVDLVNDTLTNMVKESRTPPPELKAALADLDEPTRALLMNYAAMEKIRAQIGATVDDPDTAEALKPYYNLGCKRPQFSDTYLQAFNRPNVRLIDTQGQGIERLTAHGFVANGNEYQADCIIFATGFEVSTGSRRGSEIPIIGRDGQLLSDKWAHTARSLHGIMTAGFPNLFIVGDITQSTFTLNFSQLVLEQARYISTLISRCIRDEIASIEVRTEAEERWMQHLASRTADAPQIDLACGPDEVGGLVRSGYPGGPLEYFQILRAWLSHEYDQDLLVEQATEIQPV
jgi:cyclohexanone monooxygenase